MGSELHPEAQRFREYLSFDASPSTAYNYSRNVSQFLYFTDKSLDEITPTDITDWYQSLEADGYAARSIWRFGHALRRFFDVMGMPELKRRTPIMDYEVPDPKWMTRSEVMGVIAGSPVLCVAYDLALRVGEVGLLGRSRFNPETGKIEVTRLKHKGRKNTYILQLEPWCRDILNEYLEDPKNPQGDTLFPMSVSTIQKRFNARARARGLEGYTFHSLRHSRVTHLALKELEEKGVVDELSLSRFAGHFQVETTRLYVHLATKHQAFKP